MRLILDSPLKPGDTWGASFEVQRLSPKYLEGLRGAGYDVPWQEGDSILVPSTSSSSKMSKYTLKAGYFFFSL